MTINIKWGIIAGGAAFVLAFVTSLLLGSASFSLAIIRSLIFTVIFFILGTGVWTLVNLFIPELLSLPEADDETTVDSIFAVENPGSQVNITLEDSADAALPDSSAPDAHKPGNIGDLVSGAINPAEEARAGGIDQSGGMYYTNQSEEGIVPDFSFSESAIPEKNKDGGSLPADFGDFGSGADSGIEGFESFGDDPFASSASYTESPAREQALPERRAAGNKPVEFEGDFNPKEIAAGIRTVLEKDKRG